MDGELAQLVRVGDFGGRNRWYGCGVSECLAQLEVEPAPQKYTINWNRVLGLVTALLVSACGWSAVGIAVWHFLR
jgi:hypothetical protein